MHWLAVSNVAIKIGQEHFINNNSKVKKIFKKQKHVLH